MKRSRRACALLFRSSAVRRSSSSTLRHYIILYYIILYIYHPSYHHPHIYTYNTPHTIALWRALIASFARFVWAAGSHTDYYYYTHWLLLLYTLIIITIIIIIILHLSSRLTPGPRIRPWPLSTAAQRPSRDWLGRWSDQHPSQSRWVWPASLSRSRWVWPVQ